MPIKSVTKVADGAPIKVWTDEVEDGAMQQAVNVSRLPFIHKHIALMPDVHKGYGTSVGTVIATKAAIIPYAIGVDIGCGMMAVETTLTAEDLPESLTLLRAEIERAVPHGYESVMGRYTKGNFDVVPQSHVAEWQHFLEDLSKIESRDPKLEITKSPANQLGTLGGGNHFIELCLDLQGHVWVMLHSGSRGIGNRIGTYFTNEAKALMRQFHIELPDPDLAYIPEGDALFDRYWFAMQWAQDYAKSNRELMMQAVLRVMRARLPAFKMARTAINCHHNYAELENHYGQNVYVTRKGAVRARLDDLGIIPGSMGAKSFIVRGLGSAESFCSCSHGAGRTMGREQAKRTFTVDDLKAQTLGVECRKDADVIDEIPGAYKDLDVVMANQTDLVVPVAQLKAVLCVKG